VTPKESSSTISMEPAQTRGLASQNFQAQLDNIDAKLGRFDVLKENGKGDRDGGVN